MKIVNSLKSLKGWLEGTFDHTLLVADDDPQREELMTLSRLGLARAIWRDTAILLLDEITAGLDPENEQHILQTLQRLSRRKTILMTAHRPAVLAIADQIISLEDGKEARP